MSDEPNRFANPNVARAGGSAAAVIDLVGARIAPPITRRGAVPRTDLVDRLRGTTAPVIGVIAPTGYGKTTLVAQWAEVDPRGVAWLSLDETDNDPVVFLASVAASVGRVAPIDTSVVDVLRAPTPLPGVALVPVLVAALSSLGAPILLVIDDVHALRRRPSKDALSDLTERLPNGVQLVLISRSKLPVRAAVLRARGHLVEVGPADLALDDGAAQMLLRGAGVEASRADVAHLNRVTEGWPAGLYLTALSFRDRALSAVTPARFAADDRYVADYLRSEVLSQLPAKDARFLTLTSILDRMSGPLCDAILETTGSAISLTSLSQRNLFLMPLDRQGRWFRYHHMFRAMLRSEFDRTVDADEQRGLHRRAAVWCQENGLTEDAIVHARASGDGERFAQLFVVAGLPAYREGRLETARRWGAWLEEDGLIDRHPAAAVLGASMHALTGDPAAAERWAGAARRGGARGAGARRQRHRRLLGRRARRAALPGRTRSHARGRDGRRRRSLGFEPPSTDGARDARGVAPAGAGGRRRRRDPRGGGGDRDPLDRDRSSHRGARGARVHRHRAGRLAPRTIVRRGRYRRRVPLAARWLHDERDRLRRDGTGRGAPR